MTLVSGRITGSDGNGEAGTYVYATPDAGGRFGRTTGTHTDLTGRWSLQLAPGLWTVRETGGASHRLRVAEVAIDLDPTTTVNAETPSSEGITAFMKRRRG